MLQSQGKRPDVTDAHRTQARGARRPAAGALWPVAQSSLHMCPQPHHGPTSRRSAPGAFFPQRLWGTHSRESRGPRCVWIAPPALGQRVNKSLSLQGKLVVGRPPGPQGHSLASSSSGSGGPTRCGGEGARNTLVTVRKTSHTSLCTQTHAPFQVKA